VSAAGLVNNTSAVFPTGFALIPTADSRLLVGAQVIVEHTISENIAIGAPPLLPPILVTGVVAFASVTQGINDILT
jgi:hypothetical protein